MHLDQELQEKNLELFYITEVQILELKRVIQIVFKD